MSGDITSVRNVQPLAESRLSAQPERGASGREGQDLEAATEAQVTHPQSPQLDVWTEPQPRLGARDGKHRQKVGVQTRFKSSTWRPEVSSDRDSNVHPALGPCRLHARHPDKGFQRDDQRNEEAPRHASPFSCRHRIRHRRFCTMFRSHRLQGYVRCLVPRGSLALLWNASDRHLERDHVTRFRR